MALPTSINPATPLGSDQVLGGDDQIRALKQFIVDILGLPTDPTQMTAALMDANADGTIASSLSLALKTVATAYTAQQTFNTNLVLGKGADIPSATVLTLGSDGNYFDVTGTTTIIDIAPVAIGMVVHLHFDGVVTLQHDILKLVLPEANDITTIARDEFTFIQDSATRWTLIGGARSTADVPIQNLITSGLSFVYNSLDEMINGKIPFTFLKSQSFAQTSNATTDLNVGTVAIGDLVQVSIHLKGSTTVDARFELLVLNGTGNTANGVWEPIPDCGRLGNGTFLVDISASGILRVTAVGTLVIRSQFTASASLTIATNGNQIGAIRHKV